MTASIVELILSTRSKIRLMCRNIEGLLCGVGTWEYQEIRHSNGLSGDSVGDNRDDVEVAAATARQQRNDDKREVEEAEFSCQYNAADRLCLSCCLHSLAVMATTMGVVVVLLVCMAAMRAPAV